MVDAGGIVVESEFEELAEKRSFGRVAIDLVRKHPLGAIGAAIVIAMILAAIFADYITVYDPEAINFEDMLTAPGARYILGTDHFGRDTLTRLIYGARTALFIGVTAGFLGMKSATRANMRTTAAAKEGGEGPALLMAFNGGAVMGVSVASLGLVGVGIFFGLYPANKAAGSSDHVRSLHSLVFFLQGGDMPKNISDDDFQILFRLAQYLVDRGDFSPDILELFGE